MKEACYLQFLTFLSQSPNVIQVTIEYTWGENETSKSGWIRKERFFTIFPSSLILMSSTVLSNILGEDRKTKGRNSPEVLKGLAFIIRSCCLKNLKLCNKIRFMLGHHIIIFHIIPQYPVVCQSVSLLISISHLLLSIEYITAVFAIASSYIFLLPCTYFLHFSQVQMVNSFRIVLLPCKAHARATHTVCNSSKQTSYTRSCT